MRPRTMMILRVSVFFFGANAVATEPKIAWQEEFDTADAPVDAKIFPEGRAAPFAIREVRDGILRFGLRHDPALTGEDTLNMLFGDCHWWGGERSQWGPFDLKDCPVVEVKWRGDSFQFYYGVQTASGQRAPQYTVLGVDRKETDSQGREWNISFFRAGAGAWAKIIGMNWIAKGHSKEVRDLVVEIDHIRIRGFTEEEAAAERMIAESLANFPQGRWPGLDTFFPFGTYFGFRRGFFESWDGDEFFEGAYGTLTRLRFNYALCNEEVKLSRFGCGWDEEGFKTFLAEMGRLVESARATGMKIGQEVRGMLEVPGHSPAGGYQQILPVTRRLAEAFPDDQAMISWYVYDEPGAERVLPIAMTIRALRETDPCRRPELVVFNNTWAAMAYPDYLSICFWDCYPINENSRNPWAVREDARAFRKIMPGKPMWAVLQALETVLPPEGSFVRPSDAEMRLMAYLALAEGAKGLIWFTDRMGDGRLSGYLHRTGHPVGGMAATLEDLSKRLVPIGTLLLATEPLEDARLEIEQLDRPLEGRKVEVSALKHRSLPEYYLVAVNEHLELSRAARVALPASMLGKKAGVYDLYRLDGANLLEGYGFRVEELAGGDGRVYFVGGANEFELRKARIQCERALEDIRVLTPDITVAKRWKVAIEGAEKATADCRSAAQAGDGNRAAAASQRACLELFRAIENHSELHAVRRALFDMSAELAEAEQIAEYPSSKPKWWTDGDHPTSIPNPGFLDLSKRYWTVGRTYRDLCSRYLKGESKGLWPDVHKARLDCLKMREDLFSMLRNKLEPSEELVAE